MTTLRRLAILLMGTAGLVLLAPAALAAPTPNGPNGPAGPGGGTVEIDLTGMTEKPSNSLIVFLALTLLSLLPAILLTFGNG